MKNIILFACLILTIYVIPVTLQSCKKETIPAKSQPVIVVTSQQDPALIGVWVGDSSKADGSSTTINGANLQDSIFISSSLFDEKIIITVQQVAVKQEFSGAWETKNDSLFTINHYQYSISGNKLFLYANFSKTSGNNIRYWYHK